MTSSAWNQLSPKQRLRHSPQQLMKALSLIQGKENRMVTPVSKIHCSERELPPLATKLDRLKNNKIKNTNNYRDNNKAPPNSGSFLTEVHTARTGKDANSPKNHDIDSKSFVKELNDNNAQESVHCRTDMYKGLKESVHGRTDMSKECDPNKPVSSSASTSRLKDAMEGSESFRSDGRSDERRVSGDILSLYTEAVISLIAL